MSEARSLLKRLTEEERELLEWHSPKEGWWRGKKRDDICRGCSLGLIEDCVTRATILALAESREREGELVAALRRLESVTRSYLQYPLKGEEPGYDAKDVLAYCDEALAALAATSRLVR